MTGRRVRGDKYQAPARGPGDSGATLRGRQLLGRLRAGEAGPGEREGARSSTVRLTGMNGRTAEAAAAAAGAAANTQSGGSAPVSVSERWDPALVLWDEIEVRARTHAHAWLSPALAVCVEPVRAKSRCRPQMRATQLSEGANNRDQSASIVLAPRLAPSTGRGTAPRRHFPRAVGDPFACQARARRAPAHQHSAWPLRCSRATSPAAGARPSPSRAPCAQARSPVHKYALARGSDPGRPPLGRTFPLCWVVGEMLGALVPPPRRRSLAAWSGSGPGTRRPAAAVTATACASST